MTTFAARPSHEVNSTTAGDQARPFVAALADGGHLVAWTSTAADASTSVLAQRYDASGNALGGEYTLLGSGSIGGLAALADGTLVLTTTRSWVDPQSGPQSAASYERLDLSGHVLAGPVVIGTGNYDVYAAGGPVFAEPGGGYAVTASATTRPVPWSTSTATVSFFDGANNPVGTSFTSVGWAASMQVLAEMRSGGFATVEQTSFGPSPGSIDWKVVDAQGQVTASGAYQGSHFSTDYTLGAAVGLADGRALVAWRVSTYANGSTQSVWQGQWIDASGHATGGVVSLALDAQTLPRFTALAGGGFLASWEQTTYSGPQALLAQAFDASGQPASDVLHLAAVGSGPGAYDAPYTITATPDGGFLLDLQQSNGSTGLDVYEQKWDLAPDGSVPSDVIDLAGHVGVTAIPAGNHAVAGTAALDSVAFDFAHTQASIAPVGPGFVLAGPGGTETLTGVERLQFSDGIAIALDIQGDAGEAFRLYRAAFNRAPDLPGLGFHIHDLDNGVALTTVAAHFVESPEFQATYGTVDDTRFITLLYENVLHREPESAGLQFHLGEFAQGETRADMLTHFSESPENQANVIGQVANGMAYVPLA